MIQQRLIPDKHKDDESSQKPTVNKNPTEKKK